MLSVTQRIETVSQPSGGYVPKSLFTTVLYEDNKEVKDINVTLTSIQGLAVDYLTRFIVSGNIKTSFDIPILGAQKIDEAYENDKETRKIFSLLKNITGLDRVSVENACKAVCYDTAFRKGINFYQPPEDVEYSDDLFENVPILVNRCLSFFKLTGPVIKDGITFEGGYTSLVSKGDGDYLTKDALIDLKVSKRELTSKWSLQLLMYYILGIHSIHKEFRKIKKLCIFNPLKNKSYTCNISDISDKSKYMVSEDVLGYRMDVSCLQWDENYKAYEDYSTWQQIRGSDEHIVKRFITKNSKPTGFDINNYGDGIFDITLDDYWTFLKYSLEEYKNSLRPMFKYTKSVKLIKRNGFYMFLSISSKGKYAILHGARLHSASYPLEYYYDNIERYANTVIMRFSRYWDALRGVSEKVRALDPTEEYLRSKYSEFQKYEKYYRVPKNKRLSYDEWYEKKGHEEKLSGRVHGCIVDIDWANHVYVNPYDGTVTAYNAASMYDKNVYKNVRSLLSAQRPEMLPSFDEMVRENKSDSNTALLVQKRGDMNALLALEDDEISQEIIKVYSWDMYGISNRLKPLQYIYDMKLVQIWYDEVLNDDKHLIKTTYGISRKDYIGQSKVQKNGMIATIVRYRNYKDADVKFEDGEIVEHVGIPKWRSGTLQHPGFVIEKPAKPARPKTDPKKRLKEKYIGMTKVMHCGLAATIIDYQDCKNVTVQFEDGLVKSGVRSDHFVNGKVSHS